VSSFGMMFVFYHAIRNVSVFSEDLRTCYFSARWLF